MVRFHAPDKFVKLDEFGLLKVLEPEPQAKKNGSPALLSDLGSQRTKKNTLQIVQNKKYIQSAKYFSAKKIPTIALLLDGNSEHVAHT